MTIRETVLFCARLLDYVVESAEENCGLRVEAIQKWCGGARGQSWCCYFVTMILDWVYKGRCPIARQGGVETMRQEMKAKGMQTDDPEPGDLYIFVLANHGHHIGFYTGGGIAAPVGIAGNTSKDGRSSNGKMVAEHALLPGTSTIEYYAYTPRDTP